MKTTQQKLLIDQLDAKLVQLKSLEKTVSPSNGWVSIIRAALKMSLRQLGKRLHMSAQAVKDIEKREANGTISIKSLREVAEALDMKLVYAFFPKEDSVKKMIEKRANEIAREIVLRTSNTMKLEDQENSDRRINEAIKNKTEEIKSKMPKYLWD